MIEVFELFHLVSSSNDNPNTISMVQMILPTAVGSIPKPLFHLAKQKYIY